MGILDWLTNMQQGQATDADRAYYATAAKQDAPIAKNLLNAFSMGSSDSPMTVEQNAQAQVTPSSPLLGPAPTGPTDANGNLIGTGSPPPAMAQAAPAAATDPTAAANIPGAGLTTPSAPTNDPSMAPGVMLDANGNVVSGGGTPDTSGQGGTPDQSSQTGGLLANMMGAAQQGAQDPDAAKGFFSKMADSLKDMGDKMTSLSPAASQGLIAAGMSMLANNSGRMNLAQLVGTGGEAGINQYETVKQNQVAAQLKQQELAQNLWEKQQQLITERNRPTGLQPGESYITPQMMLAGQGPANIGGQKVATWAKTKDQYGIERTVPLAYDGTQIGNGYVSDASITGAPLKVIQDAQTNETTNQAALDKTNMYLGMLSPYQMDATGNVVKDANGQPVANPNLVNVPGGLQGKASDFLTKLTGTTTDGQNLAQQIMRDARANAVSAFKGAGAARITQGEFSALTNGMPENPSNQALMNFLTLNQKAQQINAARNKMTSEYALQTRGTMLPPNQDFQVGGQTYKAGTQLDDILENKAKPTGAAAPVAPQAPATAPAAPSGGGNAPIQQPTPQVPRAPATPVANTGGWTRAQIAAAAKRRLSNPNG